MAKRRLKDINAEEKEDFEGVEISTPSGQSRKDHIIKLDTAKEMAMLERNSKGKQVRRYFIQIEKKYKQASKIMGQDTQVLFETFQKFMEMQATFMERFDVTLNSYRSVYRSEMGKPDAGMVEVVAANDRFYDLAVRLCRFMIKDYKEQEALAEGMKKFNG